MSDPFHSAPVFDEAERAKAAVAAALFGGPPPSPARVGRYQLQGRLGQGGMGVVHRAHDPELDRPVAVKLLRPDVSSDEKARARMLREARALAKLSHPNVITVFDVGTVDGDSGQVFVAMELVAGEDLRKWVAVARRWQEVLEVYLAAGRGLAAAHAAGLVHRDFKPENVLVGDDGRVRVLDFGLARVHVEAATEQATMPSGSGELVSLTETGAVLGTPLYIAPELYAGSAADAASDQFAFCASLWEALYGVRPFGADRLAAHVEAVRKGALVDPPRERGVPASIEAALRRGLSPEPGSRWPDVSSLLAALERAREPTSAETPRGSGTAWMLGIGLVILAAVGLVALELGAFSDPEQAPRQAAAAKVDPVDPSQPEPEPEPEPEPKPELQPPPERDPAADSTGEGQAPIEPPAPEPARDDWCHLHEDDLNLLSRGSKRRSKLQVEGACYACRVESRRERTRNFSPRDCGGYALCGVSPCD